eukprot:Skav218093  [mRNA]  locus=scaffold1801:114255:117578:+ [translate_table: standard]
MVNLLVPKAVLDCSDSFSLRVGEIVVSLSNRNVAQAIDLVIVKFHLFPSITCSNGKALILWDAIHWPCSFSANEVRLCTLGSGAEGLLNCLSGLEEHLPNVITIEMGDSVLRNLDEVPLLSIC